MKKKITAIFLCVALVAVAVVGASLAYFTDTDSATNTFTVGGISIDLWEDFGDNIAETLEKLLPATGSAQDGTLKNGVTKKIYVDNTCKSDAYVRVHIAIPQILDDGAETFDAGKNVLHFNYASDTIGEGKWDWSKTADDGKYEGNWNYYETTINNVVYNVYVVTYTSALKPNETTVDAIHQVYLDSKVTNSDITNIKATLGDNWHIYVVAEGCQTEGFTNAYDALNAAFGTPGAKDYTAPNFLAPSEGKILKTATTTDTTVAE